MMRVLADRPRLRAALAWVGLIAAAVILLRWVEPAVFESPYNNF